MTERERPLGTAIAPGSGTLARLDELDRLRARVRELERTCDAFSKAILSGDKRVGELEAALAEARPHFSSAYNTGYYDLVKRIDALLSQPAPKEHP